jgi:group I intron endonuclease
VSGIIYLAKNRINGKGYVGKTKQLLEKRRQQHLYSWRSGKYQFISLFYRALSKYGPSVFDWSILESVSDISKLGEREDYYIPLYGDYNILKDGNTIKFHPYRDQILQNKIKRFVPEQEKDILKDYVELKMPTIQVLKKYKIGYARLRRLLKEKNVVPHPRVNPKIRSLTKEQVEQIIEAYKANMTIQSIRSKYGYSNTTIGNILHKNNVYINRAYRVEREKVDRKRVYKLPIEVRLKMSATSFLNGTSRGTRNNKWKGIWQTPKGEFTFLRDAAKAVGLSMVTTSALCKHNLPLSMHMIKNTPLFKTNNIQAGILPKTLGFSFKEVK